jgi:hypothetical protein
VVKVIIEVIEEVVVVGTEEAEEEEEEEETAEDAVATTSVATPEKGEVVEHSMVDSPMDRMPHEERRQRTVRGFSIKRSSLVMP